MNSDSPQAYKLSVVTVCLNAEKHIRKAFDSILNQTFTDFEYVVVDGGSTDGTLPIIEEYQLLLGSRMKWVSEPDEGLYDAMNKGVALSTGAFIGILNSDDTYQPDALERALETHRARPEAGVLYGDDRTVDKSGSVLLRPVPEQVTLSALKTDHIVHHHAAFVSARVYEQLGGYNTLHPIAADYDFFLRCAEAGVDFARIPGVITNFSLQGVSHENIRATDRDATRVRIGHGVPPALAWARFYKRALAYRVYERLKSHGWFQRAYERYRATQSR